MSKYKIEPWPLQSENGMQSGKISAGVRVTDTETGHWHCCNIYRSQHQNVDAAIRTLKAVQAGAPVAETNDSSAPAVVYIGQLEHPSFDESANFDPVSMPAFVPGEDHE